MTARKLDLSTLPDWPRLMPREWAAAYLGLSPNALESLSIEPVRIGARRLYDRITLDRYVDALGRSAQDALSPQQWLEKLE